MSASAPGPEAPCQAADRKRITASAAAPEGSAARPRSLQVKGEGELWLECNKRWEMGGKHLWHAASSGFSLALQTGGVAPGVEATQGGDKDGRRRGRRAQAPHAHVSRELGGQNVPARSGHSACSAPSQLKPACSTGRTRGSHCRWQARSPLPEWLFSAGLPALSGSAVRCPPDQPLLHTPVCLHSLGDQRAPPKTRLRH